MNDDDGPTTEERIQVFTVLHRTFLIVVGILVTAGYAYLGYRLFR